MTDAPRPTRHRPRWLVYLALLAASHVVQCIRPPFAPRPRDDVRSLDVPAQRADGPDRHAGPVKLSWLERGRDNDRTVILIHGSPGTGVHDFEHLSRMLATHDRVIAPDLPGFGRSDAWVSDYSIRAHARYVLALMDALDIDRAHVFGFSMGSGVALHLLDLAPQRIASLVFYGGIGLQEGEGSGDYHFEHFKYALGYAALVVLPELIPHFGLLGPRSLRHGFIRNFWDTDQRPLRGILDHMQPRATSSSSADRPVPLLILHGRRDPLVPVWLAREHHRLVPHSELITFDDGHFMLFNERGAARIAEPTLDFLARCDRGDTPPQRRTTDVADNASAVPLLPGDMRLDRTLGPWWQLCILALATFVSEDMTCIAAGLLVREMQLDLFVAILGCFLGIFVSDLGLWLIGRLVGRRVVAWRWVARKLPAERIDAFGRWFDVRSGRAVLASRFMPGTRVPVYVAAGIAGRRPWAFMFWTALAAAVWTPLVVILVALLGHGFVERLSGYLGGGWIALLAAAVLLFILLRTLMLACTEIGRARLMAKVSRVWRWEFWPTWFFYLPLYPYIAWLALRHRGATLPTVSNPGIPHSGLVGESKYDILRRLPTEWTIPSLLIPPGELPQRLAGFRRDAEARGWTFPLILKPDAGQRGAGLKRVGDWPGVETYLAENPSAVLAQTYDPGPLEAGIFYYRMPGERSGRIFSITDKHFPVLVGDGVHTVEQLIWRHPRFRMQARTFLARLSRDRAADATPSAGERVALAVAGNHCQGTLFRDGSRLITAELERAIDAIAQAFDGFCFGRFDVRYGDESELKAGRGFRIVELNGATSESTNIYDPAWSIVRAYRTLFAQWRILFDIGAAHRTAGHRPTPLRTVLAEIRRFYRRRAVNLIAD